MLRNPLLLEISHPLLKFSVHAPLSVFSNWFSVEPMSPKAQRGYFAVSQVHAAGGQQLWLLASEDVVC